MDVFLGHYALYILLGIISITTLIKLSSYIVLDLQCFLSPATKSNNNNIDIYYDKNENFRYKFLYKYKDNSWRAYILEMPYLRGRDSRGIKIHTLNDNNSIYVCWNCSITNKEDMKNVAHHWADCLSHYISKGESIWEVAS